VRRDPAAQRALAARLQAVLAGAATVLNDFVAGYHEGRNAELRAALVTQLAREPGLAAALQRAGVAVPADVVQEAERAAAAAGAGAVGREAGDGVGDGSGGGLR
jgi:hypothetical protein